MKKRVFFYIFILVVFMCVPAMARMMEMTDSELELITGQASEIGVPLPVTSMDTSLLEHYVHLDALDLQTMVTDFNLAEIELAKTRITIDSLHAESFLGPIDVKGITVDMEAGTRIRFF